MIIMVRGSIGFGFGWGRRGFVDLNANKHISSSAAASRRPTIIHPHRTYNLEEGHEREHEDPRGREEDGQRRGPVPRAAREHGGQHAALRHAHELERVG